MCSAHYLIQSSLVPLGLHFVVRSVVAPHCPPDSLDLDFRYSDFALEIHFENFALIGFLDSLLLDSHLAQIPVLQEVALQFLYYK